MPGCRKTSGNKLLREKGKAHSTVLQLLQTIDSLGSLGEYDPVVAKDYIAKAEEFGSSYPEDPMSAEFLYKAGLMAMTVAKASDDSEETIFYGQKALFIFDGIQKIYPDFNDIRNCILYKGIVYEYILQDYENAELFYREFIARYPTDTLAINLDLLGKSAEEIMTEAGKK
jgi:outer membrane protein assembly factor BamD (BamD/ComL family)